jgi:hypothetical protein
VGLIDLNLLLNGTDKLVGRAPTKDELEHAKYICSRRRFKTTDADKAMYEVAYRIKTNVATEEELPEVTAKLWIELEKELQKGESSGDSLLQRTKAFLNSPEGKTWCKLISICLSQDVHWSATFAYFY